MALRNGSRLRVGMHDVFPHGCHLVPDSITEAQDYDEATGAAVPRRWTSTPASRCSSAGWWTWTPSWKAAPARRWSRSSPTGCPPRRPGQPFETVEFEGLQVTPYVDTARCQGRGRCGARIAFSLRATGIKAARPPVTQPGKDAA